MVAKKQGQLSKTIALIQKKFGVSSATKLGDERDTASRVKEVLPTGIEVLDFYAIGIGGLPVGRISEIAGDEGSGKTSLSLACAASAQKAGATVYWGDPELSFDEDRAKLFGVDTDNLGIIQPADLEQWFEQLKLILASHDGSAPILIAWDSVAATKPRNAHKAAADSRGVAETARIMSEEIPKISPILAAKRAHLLCVNQLRDKPGVMFGPNTITPGGRALKFYASWRAQLFGGKAVKDEEEHTGKIVTLLTIKTRFTAPFRKVRIRLDYAKGFNNEYSTLEHAKRLKVIKPRGDASTPAKGPKAHASALRLLGWVPVVNGQALPTDRRISGSGEEE